jgi:hypothetical protein
MARKWLPWAGIGIIVTVYVALTLLVYLNHPNGAGDFDYYWRGVQRIVHHVPLYENLSSEDYVGPLLQIQATALLIGLFDHQTAKLIWFFANIAILLVTLWILTRYLQTQRNRWLLWVGTILFVPTYASLWLGQITIILFALTVGGWASYRSGKPILTGVLLSVAIWTKFYPALFVVYFLWKREWQVMASAIVTGILLIVVQIVLSDLHTFVYYFTNILPNLFAEGQPALNYANQSILGFVQKIFSISPQVIPIIVSPLLMTITRIGLSLGIVGIAAYLSRKPMRQTPLNQFDLEYSQIILIALLLGSTLGIHGMLSVIVAYTVLGQEYWGIRNRLRKRVRWLCMLSFFLINLQLFINIGYLQPPSTTTLPALVLSLAFFGMMLLWGITSYTLARQTARERRQQEMAFAFKEA